MPWVGGCVLSMQGGTGFFAGTCSGYTPKGWGEGFSQRANRFRVRSKTERRIRSDSGENRLSGGSGVNLPEFPCTAWVYLSKVRRDVASLRESR